MYFEWSVATGKKVTATVTSFSLKFRKLEGIASVSPPTLESLNICVGVCVCARLTPGVCEMEHIAYDVNINPCFVTSH